jgi:putative PIN family toxin of toxin-antitoxin system
VLTRTPRIRVVVDTNVWISALLNPAGYPARIRQALEEDRFSLVASEPILQELARVIVRPRLARRYPLGTDDADRLVALARRAAIELAEVSGSVHLCRDPRDDMFIETAVAGRADVLVSRDDDLKRAPEVAAILAEHGIRVLSVQQFLDLLDEADAQGAT